MNFNLPPDTGTHGQQPSVKFEFSENTVNLPESLSSPEAYPGCLVEAMKMANRDQAGAFEAVESTIQEVVGETFRAACGRCGIAMIRYDGVVYGAKGCPKVDSGEMTLGELA